MRSKLKKKIKNLPDRPGVYIFKDRDGRILYIGKAASLRRRVLSYFKQAGDLKTEKLVAKIFDLEIRETPNVLEALILEAELIKKYLPKYNIREKDNKSFLYLGISDEKYPKPILIRGQELEIRNLKLKIIFGPFISSGSLREALKILRGIFPWSECRPNQDRPCFYYHLGKCPGLCLGKANLRDYRTNIKNLILFLSGRKAKVMQNLRREMRQAAKKEDFERAALLRNKLFALEHLQDTALIKKEEMGGAKKVSGAYHIFGRLEGYDISNISGQYAVGSMVVFFGGRPQKAEYKKFKIKTFRGPNDVGMIKEILSRRLLHSEWPRPEIIFVDGGRGQVNAVIETLKKFKMKTPVIGIAKGFHRPVKSNASNGASKNDRFIYDQNDLEMARIINIFPDLFRQIRDEAHQFAIRYHRNLRARIIKKVR